MQSRAVRDHQELVGAATSDMSACIGAGGQSEIEASIVSIAVEVALAL
jgi:hypothetical protein